MPIKLKRVYEPWAMEDGVRLLVDRLWPCGITKERLRADGWLRDAAPSAELFDWFHRDTAKWDEFRRRYSAELDRNPVAWRRILEIADRTDVTLLYRARDREHNGALALLEYLEHKRVARRRRVRRAA